METIAQTLGVNVSYLGGLLLLAAIILTALTMLTVWVIAARRRRERLLEIAEAKASRRVATIEEHISATLGGSAAKVVLFFSVVFEAISYLFATTVFQQIQLGVASLGTLVLLGLFIALGRRRTYVIYRAESRENGY